MALKKVILGKKRPAKKVTSTRVASAKAGKRAQFVTIKSNTGKLVDVPWSKDLQALAIRWRYTLSRRSRWLGSSQKSKRLEAFEAVKQLIPLSTIKTVLGKASLVEIQVPFVDEKTGWEGRLAPWEFLVSAVASSIENENPVTIVRYLMTQNEFKPPAAIQKVLYVQCAPGTLSDYFEFTTEREGLERLFNGRVKACINPTLSELGRAIASYKPTVIHLAGIDNYQAIKLLTEAGKLPKEWSGSKARDGIVLASDSPDVEPGLVLIDAETLAGVLNSGPMRLNLVTANVYHSASHICAMAVAKGAGLALGFQDTVDDALAEIFIRDFYVNWLGNKDALTSFRGALDTTRSSTELSGTGIVLWSLRSLLDGIGQGVGKARKTPDRKLDRNLVLEDDGDFSKWLEVDIKVRERLNYSMLHNHSESGGVFESFAIRKHREGILKDVRVVVILYQGSESHPYSSIFTLTEFLTKLETQVKVPLTSPIFRTVSEPMNTSLYVQVAIADRIVHQDTYRVTLLPVDEWRDTDTDRIWLPSFVLPRDPAVRSIIDRAQNHLMTLVDNRNKGFDGYQNLLNDRDPLKDVDLQVRAIWAAIVGDFRIRYINPPPSYSLQGQRLRTPSQIVSGGCGTCIDLALLFTACLEYIDIYPVVFLVSGHVFAGYWRSEDHYNEFLDPHPEGVEKSGYELNSTEGLPPWVIPHYDDIVDAVKKGGLHPIETTVIAKDGSFSNAIAEGKKNLNISNAFGSMVDIRKARGKFITPLPMIE
jgi:hypothetical protein